RERGPDPAGRERARVTVGKHLGAVRDERQPRLADLPAHGAVFLPDGRCLGLKPLPDARAPPVVGRLRRDARHAVERPAQVHGGGPRGPEQPRQLVEARQEAVARRPPQLPRPRDEAHRRRDPDERRAAQLQRADRVRHRLPTLQIALDLRLGQRALVDDPHGAGRAPGDGLDGHGTNITRKAEGGTRNAEQPHPALAPLFRPPSSAFRVPRVPFSVMSYQTLLFDVRDGIAFITINRPDKLNALNDQVVHELADAAERVATDDAIKGAILSGAGQKAFVAGADIGDLAKQGPFDGKARALRGQAVLRRFETCGKPVIAAVNGYALGGGCELAMACHLRIASDAAKFGQPEVKLGIAPGYGGTQRLPRLVGKGNALRLILTGDMIDAQEAYRIGLVNQVVPAWDLLATAEKTLRGILAMGPLAVRLALEAVDQGLEMTLDEGLLLEANHFGLLAATEDMKEGLAAFLEKRPPRFRGR